MRFAGRHVLVPMLVLVLVLGGNSGIALASATGFAAEGATVRITGWDHGTIDAAVARMACARGHICDIADVAAMRALAGRFGPVDVLVVNAGVGGFAPVRDVAPEMWDHVHDINLLGCFFAVQAVPPRLAVGGSIVTTGSIHADVALARNVAYVAAKARLRAVVRILAKQLVGKPIRLNTVSPGPIETALVTRNAGMDDAAVEGLRRAMIAAVPMQRMGGADQAAAAILFLAAEEARFVTAADLRVDGGALELR